jgi:signal transduction histidine kinase
MDEKTSVLVVDDEPNGFDVIEAHLYREGYNLSYVSSGIEALNRLDSIEPDVILLDVMMPQMDGIEVCRKIKSDPNWQHIPIIIVTALNSKEDLSRAFDAGADDFLSKPVSGIELRARVRSMLRIKHQYDALQATMQLREDLSSMIVHDLRNPLTNIMASSSLLMIDSDLEKDDLKRIELILSAARQLNSMIDNLLIMTKMESGKTVLNRVEVDLNNLIATALSEFSSVAASKNIQLNSQLSETSSRVSVDANLLRRVIDNLLSNALKFSHRNSTITLQVDYPSDSVARQSSSVVTGASHTVLKQAIIRVIDEGFGINEDQKQCIFDKYEVGKLMSGVSQIGLGLAFCKMVVEAHGGSIFVEDNQPHGSIFTVIL